MRVRSIALISSIALLAANCYGQGTISTVAGTPNCCVTVDGGTATSTWLTSLGGLVIDKQGNLYFWTGTPAIRKVDTSGKITTVAGGKNGYSGDGGPATSAALGPSQPFSGLAIDDAGNLYISDSYNHAVRMVNAATGVITTIAGSGIPGFSGDGGQATKAQLKFPAGICLDGAGNLYIADMSNNLVRKVNLSTGIISSFAGNHNSGLTVTDGVAATASVVEQPKGLVADSAGNIFIAEDNRIRKVDTGGIIHTIAGQVTSTHGFTGDGGLATAADIFGPLGMVFDQAGNLYFADNQNLRIRKIDTGGLITTYAGKTGNASTPLGDGGPASSAYIGNPLGLVMDAAGDLIFTASPSFYDVRKITPGVGLGASPGSVSFSSAIGGAAPTSQTVNITSTGGPLNFSTLAATTSGGNWLSVSPGSGTTPATLTVSANPAGLASSSVPYQGTITLTPSGSGASPLVFSVTLTVTGAGAPVITTGGIVNALGYQTTLAPDTVFVIFGSAMGPSAVQSAAAPDYPPSLAGTSITFTPVAGGAAIPAKMVYTFASQIAGLLPSSITPGTYAVKVTYNSQTSAQQNVTVVARSFGIATANSAGTGPAQATIGNVNGGLSLVRLTSGSLAFGGFNWTLTPAHPGDTLVLWGTGGGADPANDTGGTSGDQTAAGNFSVKVDGTPITPLYAGASSGYPGLWQINFTLPAAIAADCFASLQVSAGGQVSNLVTIAIAATGQTSCSSQISGATLAKLDSGGNIVMAGLVIGQSTYTSGTTTTVGSAVGGVFNRYTAAEFLLPFAGPKIDACTILDETYPASGKEPSAADAQLDAGTLKISGPGLSTNVGVFAGASGPAYNSTITTLQNGGTYTLTGAGGSQVGPFTATTTIPNNFTVTNLKSLTAVNRAQPLTVNWTGTGFDQVLIHIQSTVLTTTTTHIVVVSCPVPASLGTYTVPAGALGYLATVSAGSQNLGGVSVTAVPNGGGIVSAESSTAATLTPSLVGGGQVDFGSFTFYIGFTVNATIQ